MQHPCSIRPASRSATALWLAVGLMLLLVLSPWCARAQSPGGSLALTEPERAWIAAHPVVRVGVSTEFPPYYFADARGRYEGFVIELMNRLAQRAGLRVEYQRYARFGDTLQAMRRGEIDVTPFTSESPARRESMRFLRPLFSTQTVYVADRRLGDVDPASQFNGYRVAVERDSTAAELLAERYPTTRLQLYDSAEQAVLAAANGEADVYVGFRQVAVYFMEKHLTANLALRGSIATPGTALGPAVRKDLPELAAILDKAIDDLTIDEISAVAAKWLSRSVLGSEPRPQASLSDAQRAWVKAHDSLRLGFDAQFAPIAFANQAGGFDGLAADLTRKLASKVGLIVAVEEGGSFADVYARAQRGELDVVVAAARNEERSREFDFVGPFLRVPTVIVALSDRDVDNGLDGPGRRRLALLRQHFLTPLLRSRYPRLELLPYDSQAEALQAVRQGDADLAIGNMKVVNQLIETGHAGALRTIGTLPEGESELYFAVRKSLPEMAGVLRAGLDALSPAERAEIEGRWLRVQWNEGVPWLRVLLIGLGGTALAGLVIATLWLGNRRLRQGKVALEAARGVAEQQVAARAGFIAYLSHELRGSLGGLAGGLGLMASGELAPARERQLLGAMQASSQGLLALCERTLDFERMVQGGVDLRPAPVALMGLIEAALAPWRVQAEIKGLRLASELSFAADTQVECDAVRLTQVLQNLVGNAVKFTAQGEVRLCAGWWLQAGGAGDAGEAGQPHAPGAAPLCIAVSDSGPGVADADRERLFSAFSQGEAGHQARDGAGLGLSISARIVDAMGGTLVLAPTSPEGGSRFVVTLPLQPRARGADEGEGAAPAAPALSAGAMSAA